MWGIILAVLALAAVLGTIIWRYHPLKLLVRQTGQKTRLATWDSLGPTLPVGQDHTPQGMTSIDNDIIFASSLMNTKSIVYRIDGQSMEVLQEFDMPPEAVHTSGLAFDGQHLWAVDYISNQCYELDQAASFISGNAVVTRRFATGLKGTSACCFVFYQGELLLAISDFMHTRRTYLVRHQQAAEAGDMKNAVVVSYENEGFSQGLAWDGEYLYESENKLGRDVVNKMDLALLLKTGKARAATVVQFNGPANGIEDMAILGDLLYTSDETTFQFYKCSQE